MKTPSTTNGCRTKASLAPISFIIAISSLRTEIPTITVLLIKNTETAKRITTIAIDTIVIALLISVRVFAATSDLLT